MKKTDCENSILNSCLEEIFQGAAPPDLSQEILREWAKREASNGQQIESDAETTLPFQAPETTVDELNRLTRPAVIVDASERSSANQRKDSLPDFDNHLARNVRPRSHFGSWLVAASILVAVTAGTVWFWNTPEGHLAGKSEHPQGKTKDAGAKDLSVTSPNEIGRPANPHTDQPSSGSPRVADTQPAASAFEDDPPFGEKSPAHLDPATAPRSKPLVERLADAEVVERVDQFLQDSWAGHSVIPSPTATDSEWCRRVYLRLIGRIPTVQELQRFDDDESPERRSRLVDELLEASPYSEEYVRNWSLLWTNFLIGRQGGTQPNDKGNRDGLESYLRDACRDNMPYDRLAFELLTAIGAAHENQADFNGATNFLLSNWGDRRTLATARSCQVFLGKQLRCVQCHNHPTNDWQQERFWQLNAMFRQMHVEGSGELTRLVNRDFTGESRGSGDGEIYFELPNGELKVAYPGFPDATAVSPGGRIADVDRRQALANWMVRQDDLAAAFVNRMWGHFFGFGFVNPVDDMGPHNPPSHPELLDFLAAQFAAHDYDMKRFFKWITLSEPFGLSSKMAGGNLADTPNTGMPLFSRYYTRQLQPEEVYQSLLVVANTKFKSWTELAQDRQTWLGQVIRRMETDDGAERTSFDGGIGQSLIMMNGSLVRRAMSENEASLLSMVINADMSSQDKIEHLFLAAVSRKPTRRESQLARRMLEKGSHEPSVLQDIWWALLNSNEFILDH